MNRRDVLQQLGALALLAGSAGRALAQGQTYTLVEPPVPTDAPGKIEVLEFFHYACPHCHDFDPLLRGWLKKLPADVAFSRVPAIWNSQLKNLARVYYALLVTKHLDALHEKVFVAVQQERERLYEEDSLREWIGRQKGVDVKAFMEVYKSFGVNASVGRAEQLARAYKLDGVPLLAVGGRYLTSASMAGNSHEAALKEVDRLIEKVRRG
ncbi:MAG: thiol:disulfide interchange protein DsbA/DsbL [Azoarcus sp.]|jgi:thiol:disulfide interchange protein DsbA|nr:thiol:disulfide interchange protein DsbA/DsbL [Azoarcus sp.]